MDNIKNELKRFGIYGTKLSNYPQEIIDIIYNKEYVEIFYTQDMPKLEEDLNGESIVKLKDYKIIMENINLLNIRIKYNLFKENLSQYKFKDDYPIKMIDFLLTHTDEFIKTSEIREKLKLDPRQIYYVSKRLRENDLLIQKQDSVHWWLKLKKDELFKNGNPIDVVYDAPVCPLKLNMEIPIIEQIKNLIDDSSVGITTEDIQKNLGLSVRQGLHYLNRIIDIERNKYKSKEIFIGKIRRLLFYSIDKNEITNDQVPEESKVTNFITVEDRIRVLNEMLEEKSGIVLSEETLKQFQIKLNSSFLPCKKTVMSTALKSGHKVFTLKEKNDSKTLVVHKDVSISSYLHDTEDKTNIKFKNGLEKTFYNRFVLNSNYILRDNLYIADDISRFGFTCDYLQSQVNSDGFLIIDKEFISKLNLKFLFQIIPIDIPNVIYDLLHDRAALDDTDAVEKDIERLEILTHDDLHERRLAHIHTKNLKISFSYRRVIKRILDLEQLELIQKFFKKIDTGDEDIFDLKNYTVNTDLNIIGKNDDKKLTSDIVNNPFLIKLMPDHKEIIAKSKKGYRNNLYIGYADRIKCFTTLRSNEKDVAYNLIRKFIRQHYSPIQNDLMRVIDEIFESSSTDKEFNDLDNSDSQDFLYTKIKYDLTISDCLDAKKYSGFDYIDKIIKKLKSDDTITSDQKKVTIENCRLRNKLKLKLLKNIENVENSLKCFISRDTIYKIYFVPFYDILVKKGSMEFYELLGKIKICQDFEFINFLKAYDDVFELNEVDNCKIISVKIDVDPFDFI